MSANDQVPTRMLLAREAAAYCRVSESTLWELLAEGYFPQPIYYRRAINPKAKEPRGKARIPRWDLRDLDAYIEREKAAGVAEKAKTEADARALLARSA